MKPLRKLLAITMSMLLLLPVLPLYGVAAEESDSFDTTYYVVEFPPINGSDENGVYTWTNPVGQNSPESKLTADIDLALLHHDISKLRFRADLRLISDQPLEKAKSLILQPMNLARTNLVNTVQYNVQETLNDGEWHTFERTLTNMQDLTIGCARFNISNLEGAQLQIKNFRIVDTTSDEIRAELKAAAEETPEGDFIADTLAEFQAAQAAGLAVLDDRSADYDTYRKALKAINDAKNGLMETTYMVAAFNPPAAADENGVYTWNISAGSSTSDKFNITDAFTLDTKVDSSHHDASKLRFRVDLRLSDGDASTLASYNVQLQDGAGISNNSLGNLSTNLPDKLWHTVEIAVPPTWTQTKSAQVYLYSSGGPAVLEIKNMRIVDITNEKNADDLQALIDTDIGDTAIYPETLIDRYQVALEAAKAALDGTVEEITAAYKAFQIVIDAFGARIELVAAINTGLDADKTYSSASLAVYEDALDAARTVLADVAATDAEIAAAIEKIAAAKAALVDITYIVAEFPPVAGSDANGVYTLELSGNKACPFYRLEEATDLSTHDPGKLRFQVDLRVAEGDATKLSTLAMQLRTTGNNIVTPTLYGIGSKLSDGDWYTVSVTINQKSEDWYLISQATFYLYNELGNAVKLEIKNFRVVDITAEENLGTVQTEGIGTVNITGGLETGTTDTLIATPAAEYTLAGWTVNGKWDPSETVTVPANGKQKVTAHFVKKGEEAMVLFYTKSNSMFDWRIVQAVDAKKTLEEEKDRLPYIFGYAFNAWDTDADVLAAAIQSSAVTSVTAQYAKTQTGDYTVTVINANTILHGGATESSKFQAGFDERVEVTASETKDGQSFSYWKLDGVVAGTNTKFTFYVSGTNTIEAVYGAAESAPVVPVVSIKKNYLIAEENDGYYTWSIVAQIFVPTGKEQNVAEYGVIFAPGRVTNLTEENVPDLVAAGDCVIVAASSTVSNRQYMGSLWHIKENASRQAVAYWKDANGNYHLSGIISIDWAEKEG